MSETTIVVTGAKELASGTSQSGRDWTLYGLTATDETGRPLVLDGPLKTFDDVPTGQAVRVELERQESAKYGVEYMARRVGSAGRDASTARQIDDLRERLDSMEVRQNWLVGALRRAGIELDPAVEAPPAAPEAEGPTDASEAPGVGRVAEGGEFPTMAPRPDLDERYGGDDDIPF